MQYPLMIYSGEAAEARMSEADSQAEMAGPASGLAALDALAGDARLADHQPTWAARADLRQRLGREAEAVAAYDRAIGLEADPAVQAFLLQRRAGSA